MENDQPERVTRVSLLQGKLLSKAHSDLQGTYVRSRHRQETSSSQVFIHKVRRAVSSSQLLTSGRSRTTSPSPRTTAPLQPLPLLSPSVVQRAQRSQSHMGGVLLKGSKRTTSNGNTAHGTKDSHTIQVKVEGAKGDVQSLTFNSHVKKESAKKRSPSTSSKMQKGSKTSPSGSSTPVPSSGANSNGGKHPLKPPRKSKQGQSPTSESTPTIHTSYRTGSPVPAHKLTSSPSIITPGFLPPSSKEGKKGKKSNNGNHKRVASKSLPPPTPRPLVPHEHSHIPLPPSTTLYTRYYQTESIHTTTRASTPMTSPPMHRSLPTIVVMPTLTKRVSESVFLRRNPSLPPPRPTKTSLMRHIITHPLPPNFIASATTTTTGTANYGDKQFVGTESAEGVQSLKPREKRRRSVSCLNLQDYAQYILALRHSQPSRSPRFTRLHKLYSSLERLCELEKCSDTVYDTPILPAFKRNDFDAWWKVRNRTRIDEEIQTLSKELFEAQRDREFFFRPKTPLVWRPNDDVHLRFKKWNVEELKNMLTEQQQQQQQQLTYPRDMSKVWVDLYKTQWRGTSVKEQAFGIFEGMQGRRSGRGGGGTDSLPLPLLRRAFSMSSSLSQEQRDVIRQRIGNLLARVDVNGFLLDEASKRASTPTLSEGGGGRVTTTRRGFTLSSDPKRIGDATSHTPAVINERKKKEMSQRISEEFRRKKSERKGESLLRDTFPSFIPSTLPISTKMALRKKIESTESRVQKKKTPFYTVYANDKVNTRIEAFEHQRQNLREKPRRAVTVAIAKSKGVEIRKSPQMTLDESTKPLPPPFRSLSPNLRTPSPPRHRSLSPTPKPPPPKEYVSHINIISKLASLLLKRNTHLKRLVTREVLERDRLERLRSLNSGEVVRLREYFETKQSLDDVSEFSLKSPEISLLRCLFCSDSNLAKATHEEDKANRRGDGKDHGACGWRPRNLLSSTTRAAPDGSSPTPPKQPLQDTSNTISAINNDKVAFALPPPSSYLKTRCRKPIYQPSSTPNVCQPTLTAHCYLSHSDSLEQLWENKGHSYWDKGGGGHVSLPTTFSPPPPPLPPPTLTPTPIIAGGGLSPIPSPGGRRILDDRLIQYSNYDPAAHQPRYRYVPPPPTATPATYNRFYPAKRSNSSLSSYFHGRRDGSLYYHHQDQREASSYYNNPYVVDYTRGRYSTSSLRSNYPNYPSIRYHHQQQQHQVKETRRSMKSHNSNDAGIGNHPKSSERYKNPAQMQPGTTATPSIVSFNNVSTTSVNTVSSNYSTSSYWWGYESTQETAV